jgi:hypothetical protein
MFTLTEYRELVGAHRCPNCAVFLPIWIQYYESGHGWPVRGCDELMWLYIICNSCGQGWSIDVLGVPRFPVALFEVGG